MPDPPAAPARRGVSASMPPRSGDPITRPAPARRGVSASMPPRSGDPITIGVSASMPPRSGDPITIGVSASMPQQLTFGIGASQLGQILIPGSTAQFFVTGAVQQLSFIEILRPPRFALCANPSLALWLCESPPDFSRCCCGVIEIC